MKTYDTWDIRQIIPAPPGLCAWYAGHPEGNLYPCPVVCLALAVSQTRESDTPHPGRIVEESERPDVIAVVNADECGFEIADRVGGFLGVSADTPEKRGYWESMIADRKKREVLQRERKGVAGAENAAPCSKPLETAAETP